ncbi:MAG: response regulator [Candidatus Nanopelagicales bacterium]
MSDSGGMSDDGRRRVLLVEDEEFTRTMVSEALEANGLTVRSVATVAEALSSIEDFEPHAVISDLDLGGGPSGADLLNRIADETPWVGLVVLTSHASPELAIRPGTKLPAHVSYVMKAQVNSSGDLLRAVESAIADTSFTLGATVNTDGRPIISAVQGELLRLIAEGYSNQGIAEIRGTSLRSTESLVHRTFAALGIDGDKRMNPRVLAVRMWQQGKVVVK